MNADDRTPDQRPAPLAGEQHETDKGTNGSNGVPSRAESFRPRETELQLGEDIYPVAPGRPR
ncbi:MAG TPA: hypothetical protein VM536_13415, partial [Chloroflexia bacterium]|nr:hypothetical protein [Chloroflexia bacterium]